MTEKIKLAIIEGLCAGIGLGITIELSSVISAAITRKIDDRIEFTRRTRDYRSFRE